MKRAYRILFIICAIFVLAFIAFVIADACIYSESYSAPFSLFVLIRAAEFILPAVIAFTAAMILHRSAQKDRNRVDTV